MLAALSIYFWFINYRTCIEPEKASDLTGNSFDSSNGIFCYLLNTPIPRWETGGV